ncbi:MAG: sigma 54-interacting transcriptional regulator [Bradymonadia bacterium]
MSPPTGESGPSTLFGRDQELARLRRLHADAKADGRGRCALLAGPAGVGKTRLLGELRRELRSAGEPVFEGRCRQTDHRPYASLVELLGQAATAMSELGRTTRATERALSLLAGLPAPGDLPVSSRGEEQRLHFFEAVRAAVLELTAGPAPALFIHDLHRADVATLALLRYLLDNLLADPAFDFSPSGDDARPRGEFRGLLVLTFREADATRPLLDVARSSRAVEHIALGGLDEAGLRAFVQSGPIVARLMRATAGNPAMLEQLFGALPDEPGDFWSRRFVDLPGPARRVLEVLAVLARPVTAEQLRDLTGSDVSPGAVLQRLLELGLVQRVLEHGEPKFRFAASNARDAFLATVEPTRHIALHRRIAERLVPLVGLGAEAEEVAQHFLLAGDEAEAVPFVLAAVERLEAAFAHARAAELLTRIVDCTSGALRFEVQDRLSALHVRSGQHALARAVLERLLLEVGTRDVRVSLELRLARVHLSVGAAEEASQVLEKLLEREGPHGLALEWVALAAEAAWMGGRVQRGEALCEQGERLAASGSSPDAEGPLLDLRNTIGKLRLGASRHEEAREAFARNLDDATRCGDGPHRTRALINLGIVHLQVGEIDAAADRFAQARDLAAAAGELRHLGLALDNLAVLHHRRQDFARALELYHQSGDVFRKLGNLSQTAHTALNLAELYLTLGDDARADRLVDIARGHLRRGRWRALEAQCLALEGDLAAQRGEDADAESRYAESITQLEVTLAGPGDLLPVLVQLARCRLRGAEPRLAEPVLDRAEALPRTTGLDSLIARTALVRAELALRTGAADDAARHADRALTAALAAGDRETRWRVRFLLGELAWDRHDRSATLQSLADAVEVIESVAATLPGALRQTYLDMPERRVVRLALRRVRAGLAPQQPLVPVEAVPGDERKDRSPVWQPHWLERYPQIIGRAPALHGVFNALDRVAGSDAIVLVRGESGTGKELVASALHANGPRADGPFVKVNCSAFVETLLLSELFGHEKGAFTGAVLRKKGRFELADAGTLFLDEIGDISANTQVALLRVLQEGTFERVGGAETLTVDVRVICATHRNLEEMVRRGEFRADLYYRLRGVIIELPPLRERRADIPMLVDRFLARRPQSDQRRLRMSAEALASLMQHDWPGNVRELENVVRSAALFADGEVIGLSELRELGPFFRAPDENLLLATSELLERGGASPGAPPMETPAPARFAALVPLRLPPSDLPDPPSVLDPETAELARIAEGPPLGAPGAGVFDDDWLERAIETEGGLAELKKRIEVEAIARALKASGGNITRAAERLGMKRPRLSQIIHAIPVLSDLKRDAGEG